MNSDGSRKYRPSSGNTEAKESPKGNVVPAGVIWLCLGAGLLFTWMGWRSVKKDYADVERLSAFDSYLPTQARWLKVAVRHDTAGSAEDFHPDMLYEYFVNGQSIWGWRLSYEDLPHSKTFWEMRLKPYRVGDTVTAFVSPRDKKEAIIEKRHDGLLRPYLKIATSIAFTCVGVLLLSIPVWTGLGSLRRRILPSRS